MSCPYPFGWRYSSRNAKCRHLVRLYGVFGPSTSGICTRVWVFDEIDWRGTGSQTECDKLAELPPCVWCLKAIPEAAQWEL